MVKSSAKGAGGENIHAERTQVLFGIDISGPKGGPRCDPRPGEDRLAVALPTQGQ